ncbi:MAG: hypothetical protein ACM37W_15200 [Actinomycetota bacterium]
MKLWRVMAVLSAVLAPVIAKPAFSQSSSLTSEFPKVSNPRVNEPICYIETPSGTTFDLKSLCGSNAVTNVTPPGNNGAGNRNVNPVNNGAGNPTTTIAPNNNGTGNPTTVINTPNGTGNPTTITTTPNGVGNPTTTTTTTPNNGVTNPTTTTTTTPNNGVTNPTTTTTTTPNNGVTNPTTSTSGYPSGTAAPGGGVASDGVDGVNPNTPVNLPRVPPSSFSPGGLAPTRDSIDGPRNQ